MSGEQYIEDQYGVRVRAGQRGKFDGKPGTVTGADGAYLTVRIDGQSRTSWWHPTWHVELEEES